MKHNKYNKKDPVKVKDDLIGHNQPPGHQVPDYDIKMIKSTSVHLRALSKVLNDIAKDTEKSKFERVLNAQQAIVSTNGSIKWKHGLFEMLGVHSLR